MALFSENILDFLYGVRYSDGYRVLIILSAAMASQIFYQISYYVLGIAKKTKHIMAVNIIGMSFNLTANWVLIPAHGIIGAALATLGSSILMGILAIIMAIRFQGKFIFPWKSIGVVILSFAIVISVFLFKDRTLFFNIMIFSGYLGLVGFYGIIFEADEIKKWLDIIKRKLRS
ncbi:MAG: polysaccharide biosynthesis C-terminal domain-containing protein, partial [Elusimicrobiales bacterium]|nr:polysaccharide biosynthesis C-terminal domain-containing protein [Elusimicrobiales bacterium]